MPSRSERETPSPYAQGELARTPLAQVLMTCVKRTLTGTLVISADASRPEARFHVANGNPMAIEPAGTDPLPLFSATSAYRFYESFQESGPTSPIDVEPLALVLEGIRAHANRSHVEAVLDRIGRAEAVVLVADKVPALKLGPSEVATISSLARPGATLEDLPPDSADASERFVYFLVVIGALKPEERPRSEEASVEAMSTSSVRRKRPSEVGLGRVTMTAQPPTDPRDKIQVFKTTGLWAEAVDVLLGLLGESPEDPDLHAELAQCLLECGDRDVEASKAAGEALRIDERHVLGHVYKALVMERLGYVPRATQHLRQALEVDPDHELARRELERIDGPQESGGGLLDRFFKKK